MLGRHHVLEALAAVPSRREYIKAPFGYSVEHKKKGQLILGVGLTATKVWAGIIVPLK